jgi:hypothetical protein
MLYLIKDASENQNYLYLDRKNLKGESNLKDANHFVLHIVHMDNILKIHLNN